jgi:glutamine synthetase
MASNELQRELDDYLAAHPETRYLETLTVDMNGILRGKRAEREDFYKLFQNGMNLCAATAILDSRGHTFESVRFGVRDGDPDVKGVAVPGSLAPVPWLSLPTLQPLSEMGLTPVLATELEFYLVEHDGERFHPKMPHIPGSGLPQPGLQYAMMEDLYEVDDFLADLDAICIAQNIPAGAALSEFSPGQFEVNLHHVADPVLACDHAVLLKRAIKAAASKNGLGATFMAKPFADTAGSGLHLHMSLLDADGENVFAGESRDGPFSDRLRHAVGGMGALMAQSMAIFAPNGNSYRRHAPGNYVPACPTWGLNHRGVAMRIPLSSPANTRIEHRVAGADANPYLVVAAVLAGVHHGLTQAIEPRAMTPEGTELDYEVTVPIRWPQALDAFAAATLLPEYIGAGYHDLFLNCRREEEGNYNAEIPTKDFEWYLRAV